MKKFVLFFLFLSLVFSAVGQKDINPNGYNKFYYPNGAISSEGYLRDGKPDGYWKTYYPGGQLKSEGNRRNFQLDSLWIFYAENGDTLKKINYSQGERNGYYFAYQVSNDTLENTLLYKELYVSDKRQGTSYYYYPNGSLHKKINYKDNEKHGWGREYNREGKVITLFRYRYGRLAENQRINRRDSQGRKQGAWIEFYDNGKKKTVAIYRNGKLHGLYKEYNPNGKEIVSRRYREGEMVVANTDLEEKVVIKEVQTDDGVIRSGGYKKGKPVGIHQTFTETGDTLEAIVYNQQGKLMAKGRLDPDGKKQGKWQFFYETGELKSEGQYLRNMKHGTWTYFYKTGEKEQLGKFVKGYPEGTWKWFYKTGELLREEQMLRGRLDGMMVEYDKEGEIITKGKYIEDLKEEKWYYHVGDHTEEGNYLNGEKNGMWKHYYLDGTLKFEGNYVQGYPNGRHRHYFPNKKIEVEGKYRMGKKIRDWKYYNSDGILIMTITYKDGEEYKIDGRRITEKK